MKSLEDALSTARGQLPPALPNNLADSTLRKVLDQASLQRFTLPLTATSVVAVLAAVILTAVIRQSDGLPSPPKIEAFAEGVGGTAFSNR